ncbi:fumarylacetoacetate hydrolase family protein [Conexibacter sp. CPCC 206217]|uniref:fumarylacetoacetate hydrolase family protein n=1 Tax=Conexibacter sp. CPCC 206217 TaxID=3064574 RepID=UPI002726F930|nr:fumarylacetoacetate hydrolase family protein [Conexibacter sp. CPCC 206217]MDO8210334.1 fumarylacetoacetate hydrolase family protein [Conexibacter sp. CPCC 206217]
MRLATVRHQGGTCAARIEGETAALLDARDLGELLARGDGAAAAARVVGEIPAATARYAPPVTAPTKVVCVGMNYRGHIEETGEPEPEYPTLFAKFADALIGASDEIVLPRDSERVDWEVELVAVVGRELRHADADAAAAGIAGFTVGNDISVRDWQGRTTQWLQGKTFDSTTPVGPCVVTTDEIGTFPDLEIRCEVDGELRQRSRTSDLLRGPAELISYISAIVRLHPGDLVFTGTPAGTGIGHTPPLRLEPGQSVASSIEGIGALLNPCVAEPAR